MLIANILTVISDPILPSVVEEVQDESKWWNNTPSELEVLPVASITPAKSHATPHYTPAATPSGFSLNADQIQLKYSSPNNVCFLVFAKPKEWN